MYDKGCKWALESITMNKASGGDGIPVKLFQILKDDAMKVLYASKFGNLSSGHRTGNGQFSLHSVLNVKVIGPFHNVLDHFIIKEFGDLEEPYY